MDVDSPTELLSLASQFAAELHTLLGTQFASFRTALAASSTRSSLLIALNMVVDGQRLCPIFGPPGTGNTLAKLSS